jgi:hypothetical protein
MQMNRTRERADRFELRGWTYPFHRQVDGPVLSRLDPDTAETQWLPLRGRKYPVEVRPGDVQSISRQVLGIELPPCKGLNTQTEPPSAEGERVTETDGEPIPDSSAPMVSEALRALMRPEESIADAKARLTAELRAEFEEVNNLNMSGAGERAWEDGNTVADRFKELSALFDELARLGDVRPANG